MARARILVVEDERNIRDLVCLHLGHEGYGCDPVSDGKDALRRIAHSHYDLVVVDVMIPELDGLALCRAIRNGTLNARVPILILTARAEESDKVVGLESGADDYLTKPFGVREFVARVRALLRRHQMPDVAIAGPPVSGTVNSLQRSGKPAMPLICVRGFEVDPARHCVRVDGRTIEPTDQEFRLLYFLAKSPGVVFSREALLKEVWRDDTFVTVRSVDALIKRLRLRVESDPARPRFLLTVWGVGYKFAGE